METSFYTITFAFLVSIFGCVNLYPVTVANATQLVLSINRGYDFEILGPGDRLESNDRSLTGKIVSQKDPNTQTYKEINKDFKVSWRGIAPGKTVYIMGPAYSTDLQAGEFIQ